MATIKQQKFVEKLVENGGNVSRAMRDVGYSDATVNNPSNLTHSKGYREILAHSGLTEDLVIQSLVTDIVEKPGARIRELGLASDLLGLRKKGMVGAGDFSQQERVVVSKEMAQEQAYVLDEYLKAKLLGRTSVFIEVW